MFTAWTGAYCAFAAETFLKTGESVIASQRAFLLSSFVGMLLFQKQFSTLRSIDFLNLEYHLT